MAISELEKAMANLRIGLAEIQAKERQLDALVNQFQTQLRRFPRQVVYGMTGLDASLAAMGEVEERLDDALATRRRLLEVKRTATEELEALVVLKSVDEARTKLASLKKRARLAPDDQETAAEIRHLEEYIAAHSKLAEQAITARYQERDQARNKGGD